MVQWWLSPGGKAMRLRSSFKPLVWTTLAMWAYSSPASEFQAVYGTGPTKLIVATGSPGEVGLLEALAQEFNNDHPTTVCWRQTGSGESLELLKNRQADVAMVHTPAAEKQAVAEGWAAKRTLVGCNEFYIVGPKDDPADIAKVKSAADAFAKIAVGKSEFFSRGDNSGTHKKELAVWQKAGMMPAGGWYTITKESMLATLRRADKEHGYFMTDSSTWIMAKKELPNLKVLLQGDPILMNIYHALCRPETPQNQSLPAQFIDFMASEQAQKIIREFGKAEYGEPLYNDARFAKGAVDGIGPLPRFNTPPDPFSATK
jgi:tungstate transport system substrate-binding protein